MNTKFVVNKVIGNMQVKELSKITGYHENTIHQWKSGKAETSIMTLNDIVQACGYKITIERIEK
jgi:transposase